MKKVIIVSLVVAYILVAAMAFAGCGNQSIFDTTWSFEEAIIFLPDGDRIEGKIESWTDFDSSDMIQVTIGGKTYLTHSSNVIMISTK